MKTTRLHPILALIMVICAMTACTKSNVAPVVTLKFATDKSSFNESQGTVNAEITLSTKASQDIVLTYSWVGADSSTYLGGDFSFVNPSPLTIKAGETSAKIGIQILDDTQIDKDDVIKLTMVSATGATVSGTATEATHALTITNNDVASAAKLQIDLTWKIVSSTPADVNGVNLDLFAQYDVVITNNQITSSGTNNSKSVNTTGFETIFINTTDPDKTYYLAINYLAGTSSVVFAVALNGWGWDNTVGGNVGFGDFVPADTGNALFFGPFTKVSNAFTFGRSVQPQTQTQILKFKVSDFVRPK